MAAQAKRFDWVSVALTVPMLLLLVMFIVFPVALTVRNAFTSVTFIGVPGEYVGLKQFERVIQDRLSGTASS